MLHIRTKSIPIETVNSVSIMERYNSPICRTYNTIRSETLELNKKAALQMSVKALNDLIGPDGLVPAPLLFSALLRLRFPSNSPLLPTYKRALALRKASAVMSKHFSSRKVRDALKVYNGPDVTDIL